MIDTELCSSPHPLVKIDKSIAAQETQQQDTAGSSCLHLPCGGAEALLLRDAVEGQAPELLHADGAGCQLLLEAPQPGPVRWAAPRGGLLRACK